MINFFFLSCISIYMSCKQVVVIPETEVLNRFVDGLISEQLIIHFHLAHTGPSGILKTI